MTRGRPCFNEATCQHCGRQMKLTSRGNFFAHVRYGSRRLGEPCPGSGTPPEETKA